jgi:hypothetical protein
MIIAALLLERSHYLEQRLEEIFSKGVLISLYQEVEERASETRATVRIRFRTAESLYPWRSILRE